LPSPHAITNSVGLNAGALAPVHAMTRGDLIVAADEESDSGEDMTLVAMIAGVAST
jgi:hypothetical protein